MTGGPALSVTKGEGRAAFSIFFGIKTLFLFYFILKLL
jgi:hypothetical protein